jgi:hypothetical protein
MAVIIVIVLLLYRYHVKCAAAPECSECKCK